MFALCNQRKFACCAAGAEHHLTVWLPAVSLAAGTQSFTEATLNKRNGNGNAAVKVRNVRRFTLVDYELALPVTYTVGKLALSAGWRYVVPVNLPADDTESRALSVWTAGLTVTL